MKYAPEIGSGTNTQSFIEVGSGIQKLRRMGGYTETAW
jgi:hypothetical protein